MALPSAGKHTVVVIEPSRRVDMHSLNPLFYYWTKGDSQIYESPICHHVVTIM